MNEFIQNLIVHIPTHTTVLGLVPICDPENNEHYLATCMCNNLHRYGDEEQNESQIWRSSSRSSLIHVMSASDFMDFSRQASQLASKLEIDEST